MALSCAPEGNGYRHRVPADDVVAERFRPAPPAVSAARRFVRRALEHIESAPAGDGLVDSLIMAANELTTNAVLHARTEFTVRVLIDAHRVRVEVSDGNTRMPQPCLAPADATSGRGLAIVDGTGLPWGTERHPHGKTVWVEAPLHALRVVTPWPVVTHCDRLGLGLRRVRGRGMLRSVVDPANARRRDGWCHKWWTVRSVIRTAGRPLFVGRSGAGTVR
jgi:Histidine kinase-like ATPase domain